MNLTGTPLYIKEQMKPVKDPSHLAYVRTLPCVVPGCKNRKIEAMHTGGRGLSQKSSDKRAIPGCADHHHVYHKIGRRRFEEQYGIDIERIIQRITEKPRLVLAFDSIDQPGTICKVVGFDNALWVLVLRGATRLLRARSLDRAMEIAQRIIPDFCREVYLSELPK